MSLTKKWMTVADTVRRLYHFLWSGGEFYFDVVGKREPKKITPMHWQNW